MVGDTHDARVIVTKVHYRRDFVFQVHLFMLV